MKETVDLGGGYILHQPKGVYPCGNDAVFLAYSAAKCCEGTRFADLCSGSGVIGILVCKRKVNVKAVCFEIQQAACDAAIKSIEDNKLSDRMRVISGDIKDIRNLNSGREFDFVTVNPPYMKANSGKKPADEMIAVAKQEILCNLNDVLSAAEYLLKPSGQLFIVYRPERYEELILSMASIGLNPVMVREVRTKANDDPQLIIVQARKGKATWLEMEKPLVIYNEDGEYTDEVSEIYAN